MMGMHSIAIVGGNAAGLAAARHLRACGFDGRVILLDSDPRAVVQRPPLSKAVLGGAPAAHFPLIEGEALAGLGVELRLGVRAQRLDISELAVELDSGERLVCDRVLLATGATPIRPPLAGPELAGVHTLRTPSDAESLAAALAQGGSLVVIGGGVIGAEVASTAIALGCRVTIVEALPELMVRAFGSAGGRLLRAQHERAGVEIRRRRRAVRLVGVERVEGVELDDGEVLPAEIVLLAVGATAADGLAAAAGLACRDGVLVDMDGQTQDPRIFAAGDVARYAAGPWAGRRFEQQQAAEESGRRAALRLLGRAPGDWPTPYVWSDQAGGVVQLAGDIPDDAPLLLRGGRGSDFLGFALAGGRIAGVLAFNGGRDFAAARRLVGRAIGASQLCDPAVSLRDLALATST